MVCLYSCELQEGIFVEKFPTSKGILISHLLHEPVSQSLNQYVTENSNTTISQKIQN